MGYFKYKMIRRDGRVLNGVMALPFNAASSVHEHFEQRGLTVIGVRRISDLIGWLHHLYTTYVRGGVRREELIEVLRNLGVMLRSGVPILTAIEDVTTHSENPTLIRVAEDVRLGVQTGLLLAEAVDRHPRVFPEAVRQVIRIGEESGNLARTLTDAAEHLERVHRISTDTKKSLIYPCFVTAAILGATLFWVYYVIPSVADLFRNMRVELPQITLFVLSAVEYLERNLRWMVAALALIALAVYLWYRLSPGLRKWWHRTLLVLPVTGKIVRASNLAFIAEYFSLFTSSGVDLLKSLEILEQSLRNLVYREKIAEIRRGLMRGNSLAQEFGRSKVFPTFVVRMINVGERSGNLAEQLAYVAEDYRRRLNDTVERIAEVMKPVTLILVGAFFVFIVIALFLPIYYLVAEITTSTTG